MLPLPIFKNFLAVLGGGTVRSTDEYRETAVELTLEPHRLDIQMLMLTFPLPAALQNLDIS